MNERHDTIARLVSERMRLNKEIKPGSVAQEFGVGSNQAYMIWERAREIHCKWQLSHFRGSQPKVAA